MSEIKNEIKSKIQENEEEVLKLPEKDFSKDEIARKEALKELEREKELDEKYSLKNFESKVTLFYSLATGDIKLTAGGIQDMDFFGPAKADYNYGYIVIDKDDYLLSNLNSFVVKNGKIKLKYNPLSKYDIA